MNGSVSNVDCSAANDAKANCSLDTSNEFEHNKNSYAFLQYPPQNKMGCVVKIWEKCKKDSTCFGVVEFAYTAFYSVPSKEVEVVPESCFEEVVLLVFAVFFIVWFTSGSQNLQLLQFQRVFRTKDLGAKFSYVKDHNSLAVFFRWCRIVQNQLCGRFNI